MDHSAYTVDRLHFGSSWKQIGNKKIIYVQTTHIQVQTRGEIMLKYTPELVFHARVPL